MSLAITEKRPQQRPGSCVGIFFKFFSKKKLFSKKLLPPAKRTAAKKFTGDDKISPGKLLLIADDNRSGYPKPDPEPEPDADSRMQAPGIVARLMGLELMPVATHEKSRKALCSKVSNADCLDRSRLDHDLHLENADNGNPESRPQKQQKTEGFVERVAADVFHRGLVTGSRRKLQVRLGTLPTKSPRLLSRSNTARLVEVANRILEPRLHSRSRAKCAIMYRGSLEGEQHGVEELSTGPLVGSCSSCGALVAVKEPLVSGSECSGLDICNGYEERKELNSSVVPSGQSKNGPEANQPKLIPKENNKSKSMDILNGQAKSQSLSVQTKLNAEDKQDDPVNKSSLKKNGSRQNPFQAGRDEIVRGAKVCSRKQTRRDPNELHGSKEFLASNKNLNGCARSGTRSPQLEKNTGGKKRPINSSPSGSVRAASTASGKEKGLQTDVIKRKEITNSRSIGSKCIKTAVRKLNGDNLSGSKDNKIVSFAFNSPMSRASSSLTREGMMQRRRGQGELGRDCCRRNELASDEKLRSLVSPKVMTLRGDALSSLLEEKIRELSSLDQDELDTGNNFPRRSTASILEELISALTVGVPELENKANSSPDMSVQTDSSISYDQISNFDKISQVKDQPDGITAYISSDTNQPSPVSTLEVPFSNDSCSLGSPIDSLGKSQLGLSEVCKKTLLVDSETNLADTATSSPISQSNGEKIHHSINRTSSMYQVGVQNTEISEDDAAILELLFESISVNWSDGSAESSFDSFLLKTLETIMDVSNLNFHAKEGNLLREFVLECLVECLNTKISLFWRSGFRTWAKHPLILGGERLMGEIHAEIRGWMDLAGKFLNELVEKDTSMTDISWDESKAEAFDIGVEIQSDILQTLVDEMLLDLCC